MQGTSSLRQRSSLAAAATLLLLLQVAQVAHGHGTLKVPRSRNDIFFNSQWSATAGNGLGPKCSGPSPFGAPPGFCRPAGQPGVCGDPYQEVSPNTNIAAISSYPIQATYTAGQTVTFSVLMQVNHGGRMAFRLCDRRTNLDQACFNARPLLRADNNKPNWYILSGKYADPPTTISMTYKLPAGFSCPNGCTIQWEYFTYNTCLEACPREECRSYADRMNYIIPPEAGQGPKPICAAGGFPPEIFYNCADVVITGGSGPVPPSSPSPSPRPPTPSPAPSPAPPRGSDPCPGIAPGQSRATCFCSKKPAGRYQDVTYACSGGFWCYSGGSQYITCTSGLRYDATLGVCNWASSVTCSGSGTVGPASAALNAGRRPRRAFRPRAVVNATEAAVASSEPIATAATIPAVSDAAAVPSEAPAAPPVVDNADVVAAATAPADVPAASPPVEGADDVAAATAAADTAAADTAAADTAATAEVAATQAADATSGAAGSEQPAVPTNAANPNETMP